MKNVAIKGISGGEFCLTLQAERGVDISGTGNKKIFQ